MTDSLPAPRSNLTATGLRDRGTDVVTASTLKVAAGDYTGGASEDLFTLASHGLKTGDVLHVLWQSAMGAVTGGVGLKCLAKYVSSSTFHITDLDGTTIENTADGTVMFLAGNVDTALVELGVLPNLLVVDWDFTGGTVEDMGSSATTGLAGLYQGDTLKLIYKSAAGVTAGTAGTTYFAKNPTVSYFQISATSGGAVIDSTADGTAVFLKTS